MKKHEFSRISTDVKGVKTKYRNIKTSIPAPGTDELLKRLEKYESRSMQGQIPIVWQKAEDFNIFDHVGNKWIDFTSTIFVSNIGHGNKALQSSLKKIIERPLFHTYAYINEERSKYHKKLIEFAGSPFEKAFLLSAGTEATEGALKLMRMNGQKLNKRRLGIICLDGNWHGRTMGAQMMSGNLSQKKWIGNLDPDIHHIPFPYPWIVDERQSVDFLMKGLNSLAKKGVNISKDICGFMLETFQGWGAIFYPESFVSKISEICRENNILLTFDEMQAGFARTGKKFGFEHYNVKPDLICCGKGIASGLPLSALIGSKNVMDLPEVGNMSSTHSANPISCVAGITTIDEIHRLNLVEETSRKSKILFNALNKIKEEFPKNISWVLGKGLIAAILFKKAGSNDPDIISPSKICELAMQQGLLLVHTGRESIKIGPPLTISDDALIEGLDVLHNSIKKVY